MSGFKITPLKQKNLREKMRRCGVKEKDLVENFIRSGGPGGQHANKNATCVYLKHVPTGIEVKCSRERSQSVNRFLARKMLLAKLEKRKRDRIAQKRHKKEKLRRQRRTRSRKGKEKILAEKKKRSKKKDLRRKIDPGSLE
ncbi:MAG: peptide chain release factor-like protein [Candidatus Omnitrophica bacterium]|nr:peptide chain release factor-like protein [Candidatus Omnitrophota bacterium]